MSEFFNQQHGFNLAKVTGDLAAAGANGLPLLNMAGTSYDKAKFKMYYLRRVFGSVTSGKYIVINKFDGTTLTPLTNRIYGGTYIDIPGLLLESGDNQEFRITGDDTGVYLTIQFAIEITGGHRPENF